MEYTPSDVTIYVPAFNAETTLNQCLDGIEALAVRPARIIIVDDGSDVPVASRAEFQVTRHEKNLGLGAARNTALTACRTPLLSALDADIVPERNWLARLLESINFTHAVGAGGMVNEQFQDTLGDRWRAIHMAQHWGDSSIANPRFLYGANTLFVARELRAAGGYDAELRSNNEDRTISEAIYKKGLSLFYNPAACCRHLRRDSIKSILPGYWRWHHAAGLLRGDYDAYEKLIKRINSVNFGIFRHRFNLDLQAGRNELLGLDAALPWIFCAMDIIFCSKRNNITPPAFPPNEILQDLPDHISTALLKLLPESMTGRVGKNTGSKLPSVYLKEFTRCLNISGWRNDCRTAAMVKTWNDLAEL